MCSTPVSTRRSGERPRSFQDGWNSAFTRIYISKTTLSQWRQLRSEQGVSSDNMLHCIYSSVTECCLIWKPPRSQLLIMGKWELVWYKDVTSGGETICGVLESSKLLTLNPHPFLTGQRQGSINLKIIVGNQLPCNCVGLTTVFTSLQFHHILHCGPPHLLSMTMCHACITLSWW